MAWSDLENQLRQQGQQVTQAGQQMVNTGVDQPIAAKLQALQQMGSRPPPPMPSAPQAPVFDPNQALPNAPTMTAPDQQSRMAAMIAANQNMQGIQAKQAAQAQQDQAAEDHTNSLADQPMSGYQDVQSEAQKWAAQPQPRHFQNLQKKVSAGQPIGKKDIRDSLKGAQEVTPELEAKLYPKDDQ